MRDRVLWSILVLGLALRVAFTACYPYLGGRGDQGLHYALGTLFAEFGPRVLGHWGPGYEVFLGGIFELFGPNPLSARLAQIALSVVSIGLVYGVAACAGGRRAGRVAALLWAVYPTSIVYTAFLYSETLFMTLLLGAIYLVFQGWEREGRTCSVSAAVLFGLAALTRSVALYFLPFWIVWAAARRRGPECRRAAVIFAVGLAVVLPWTVRNVFRYDGFLLIDGTTAPTLWLAYNTRVINRDLGFRDRASRFRLRPPAGATAIRNWSPSRRSVSSFRSFHLPSAASSNPAASSCERWARPESS
ncbi:MAG: ArnT family glycosyltransferase [Myxococcota bacterium]